MKLPANLKLSSYKIIDCVNSIYFYDHTTPYAYSYAPYPRDYSYDPDSETSQTSLSYSIHRARKNIEYIIQSNLIPNIKPQFLTLTYHENQSQYNTTIKDFTKAIRYLNNHLPAKLRYLAVLEKQQRGAYHVHVIIFNVVSRIPSTKSRFHTIPELDKKTKLC